MNYLLEINAFYDWLETNDLPTGAIVLWHALMHVANKTRWQDTFSTAVSVLENRTGLSRQAVYSARNKLRQAGRIDFTQRRGNQCAVYRIIPFVSTRSTQEHTQTDTQAHTQAHTISKQNKTKPISPYRPPSGDKTGKSARRRRTQIASEPSYDLQAIERALFGSTPSNGQ